MKIEILHQHQVWLQEEQLMAKKGKAHPLEEVQLVTREELLVAHLQKEQQIEREQLAEKEEVVLMVAIPALPMVLLLQLLKEV